MAYFLSTYFPGVCVREEVADAWEALSMFAAQKTATVAYFEEGFLPLARFDRYGGWLIVRRPEDRIVGMEADPSVAGLLGAVPDTKITPVLQQLLIEFP